ncbi:Holliday junction resolvase RuvX [Pseudenhygromyxa sp. WMMC2535]|uniref:Holliday junction resolvase RuvX n=1 Tax=Pseudenhygromyxa sp. WMMC2535 TaxID=2712867 RepID=UPI0015575903|nr:Holliday junction resolvase RuvX [Pseudenhygromyxa sp. WMMC2535]NVB39102.1 Holliday junction resolvase RuvX [Pseudenhygromyxa sp. WMMC2535]
MRTLALDVGSKTIGLALSDAAGELASALEVLARKGQVGDTAAVLERVASLEVDALVVGLPLELDGNEGHRARLVRRFLKVLEAAITERGLSLPVHTWDERFSTAAAERTLLEANLSRAKRKQTIDAVAAQFILQGWLDRQRRASEERLP